MARMRQARLGAIVLTKDEAEDLPDCLESLHGVADIIVVVDSGSKDETVPIAERFGATVMVHEFESYASQLNWALDNAGSDCDWWLRIDADERLSPRLRRALEQFIVEADSSVVGAFCALRTVFLGKRLRFGGTFPTWLLRVWRVGSGRCEQRWMDEHIKVTSGTVVKLEGELVHIIPKNLASWTRKHVWYAERECKDVMSGDHSHELVGQAGVTRLLKNKMYYRLPSIIRVCMYFAYRYVVLAGFLDGKIGFVYHFLQCAWYRMLVDAMLHERKLRGNGHNEYNIAK